MLSVGWRGRSSFDDEIGSNGEQIVFAYVPRSQLSDNKGVTLRSCKAAL